MADGDQGNQGGQQNGGQQQQQQQQQQQPAWHAGLDAELIGTAQRKGWDMTDPAKAFAAAATAYGGAERLVGAPPEKVLRMPEPTADPATIDAFWQRLGATKDPKEIDFATVKSADGKPFDEKLAEVIRATAVSARAPKEVALATAAALQKHFDTEAASAKTVRDAKVAEDMTALDKSWGPNKAANMFIANQALEKLALKAQMPLEQAKAAWDALTKVGGIGAVDTLRILHTAGLTMGEDRYIGGGGNNNGNMPMTREAALSEISALKGDAAFRAKILAGDKEANDRWTALHKIGHGQQAA